MSLRSVTTDHAVLPWESHCDHLKRLLISLTRDPELADDLLQETYLCASRGWLAYQGGDLRAWLCAIARNVFYSHCRRRYLRAEVPLDEGAVYAATTDDGHLLLDLRAAIAELSPLLRDALILRHYGGCSYQEIAVRQRCPLGTAKWRVSTAIGRLKDRFGIREEKSMTCGWKRIHVLDYLYGALPEEEATCFEHHLDGCAACREDMMRIKSLLQRLDKVEGSYKALKFIDVSEYGMPVEYSWSAMLNDSGTTLMKSWWTLNKDHCVEYAMFQHRDIVLEMLPDSPSQYLYQAPLPEPVAPGASYESLLVHHPVGPAGWAERLDEDRWRYRLETSPNTAKEWVYLLTIRLPEGAKLLSAEPAPTDTQTISNRTTVTWRALLKPGNHPQFTCEIIYRHTPTPGAPVEARSREARVVQGAPDELFAITDLPYVGGGAQALSIFKQIITQDFPYRNALVRLGLALFDGRYYHEALAAFTRAAAQHDGNNSPYAFLILVWQGQLLDLLGRREEAIRCYQQALELDSHPAIQHSQYGLLIDRVWAEQKLAAPFERPPEINIAIYQLPHTGAGEQTLESYRQLDLPQYTYLEPLCKLGITLYDRGDYHEALACFNRLHQLARGRNSWFTTLSLAWQGMVLDLLGCRDEAIQRYRMLLEHGIEGQTPLFADGMTVDRVWVEQRLQTPFVRETALS